MFRSAHIYVFYFQSCCAYLLQPKCVTVNCDWRHILNRYFRSRYQYKTSALYSVQLVFGICTCLMFNSDEFADDIKVSALWVCQNKLHLGYNSVSWFSVVIKFILYPPRYSTVNQKATLSLWSNLLVWRPIGCNTAWVTLPLYVENKRKWKILGRYCSH